MIYRGVLLVDGSSDAPLARHLEVLCSRSGFKVRITTPDLRRLPDPPGLSVTARLEALKQIDGSYDIVFVHRDAEREHSDARIDEIEKAIRIVLPGRPYVPVVPVRMTEAWLLLDERAIRAVAGRPSGRSNLSLPSRVEELPDPKRELQQALARASGASGRRLTRVKSRFNEHRRQLLERLDVDGPVTELGAWQDLLGAIEAGLAALAGDG